jgi:hypothetical protein
MNQTIEDYTADDLARDLAGTNNGYLFAPTGRQLRTAREHPERFVVAYGNETFPNKILPRSPLGALEGRNIDEANNLLRQGLAGAREAAAYAEKWNACGRLTVARVEMRAVSLPGVSAPLLSPWIVNR